MNILCFWHPDNPTDVYNELIRYFGSERFCYFYKEEKNQNLSLEAESESFYIYEPIEDFLTKCDNARAVEPELIKALRKYEGEANSLIYRWRTTLLRTKEYAEIKDLFYRLVKYWNDYLDKNDIGLFILECMPHIINEYIPYILCKEKGIKLIIADQLSMVKGMEAKTYFRTEIETIYPEFIAKYEKNIEYYSQNSKEEISLPYDMEGYFEAYGDVQKRNEKTEKTVLITQSKNSIFSLIVKRSSIYLRQKNFGKLTRKARDFFTRGIAAKKLRNYVETLECKPEENEKFVLFLLHYQPEASTCPQAGIFDNQEIAIDMLLDSLPEDVKLYVKEHPVYWTKRSDRGQFDDMRDYRSRAFYHRLASNKKVRLIEHSYKTKPLAGKALAVSSINGTVIFENIFRKIPLIMFGNSFFSDMKGLRKISTLEQCRKAMDDIVQGKYEFATERDIAVFLKTIAEITVTGAPQYDDYKALGEVIMTEEENMQSILRGIINFYEYAYK